MQDTRASGGFPEDSFDWLATIEPGRIVNTPQRLLRQTVANIGGHSMLQLRLLAVLGGIGVLASAVTGGYYLMRIMQHTMTSPQPLVRHVVTVRDAD